PDRDLQRHRHRAVAELPVAAPHRQHLDQRRLQLRHADHPQRLHGGRGQLPRHRQQHLRLGDPQHRGPHRSPPRLRPEPTIPTLPPNPTPYGAGPATSIVTAAGAPPLNYQWQHLVGSTWTNVGSNSATFTISSVTTADAGGSNPGSSSATPSAAQ